MTLQQQIRHLRHANAVARAAMDAGHHPFGALLVASILPALILAAMLVRSWWDRNDPAGAAVPEEIVGG